MKAIMYTKYGAPDVLQFIDLEKPEPRPDEVLIRIHETIVTPTDVAGRKGDPFIVRFFNGFFRPRDIPGSDLAGVVDAIGANGTRFKWVTGSLARP